MFILVTHYSMHIYFIYKHNDSLNCDSTQRKKLQYILQNKCCITVHVKVMFTILGLEGLTKWIDKYIYSSFFLVMNDIQIP